jgi:dihydrofolate synthase/folylpolyglutamate synthase
VETRSAVGGQVVTIRGLHGKYDDVYLSLFGSHQARNAALAIAACEAFTGGRLSRPELEAALGGVRVPGRIEVVGRRPLVVCDGAHNIAASAAVREAVAESFTYDRLLMVVGMVDTKLVEDVLSGWAPLVAKGFATAPATERAASSERVAGALASHGAPVETFETVGEALDAALGEASEDDMVLVFGSFYTVGEARAWLRSKGVLTHP